MTSALDVLVQAAVIELLLQLQRALGLAMLFVTHNLPLVRSLAQRGAVLADGKVVEKDDVSGTASGTLEDLRGPAGTWTLTVERTAFAGSYSVRLTC